MVLMGTMGFVKEMCLNKITINCPASNFCLHRYIAYVRYHIYNKKKKSTPTSIRLRYLCLVVRRPILSVMLLLSFLSFTEEEEEDEEEEEEEVRKCHTKIKT